MNPGGAPAVRRFPRPSRGWGFWRFLEYSVLVGLIAGVGTQAWLRWEPADERPVAPGHRIVQWRLNACGPAALATVLEVHGKRWEVADLEKRCRLGEQGVTVLDLARAAAGYGLAAEPFRALRPEALADVPRPYVLHLARGHFLVVEQARGAELVVFDPASGRRRAWPAECLFGSSNGRGIAVVAGERRSQLRRIGSRGAWSFPGD